MFRDIQDGLVLLQLYGHVNEDAVNWAKVNKPPYPALGKTNLTKWFWNFISFTPTTNVQPLKIAQIENLFKCETSALKWDPVGGTFFLKNPVLKEIHSICVSNLQGGIWRSERTATMLLIAERTWVSSSSELMAVISWMATANSPSPSCGRSWEREWHDKKSFEKNFRDRSWVVEYTLSLSIPYTLNIPIRISCNYVACKKRTSKNVGHFCLIN